MTTETEHPPGLLTTDERDTLTDPETDPADREVVYEHVRKRLRATLRDCQALYPTLREDDIEAVFSPDDDQELSVMRAATQNALGLLVLGMLANDDLVETRISDAVQQAALAHGEDVSVSFEFRRGPPLTPEQGLTRFETEGLTDETLDRFEHLCLDSTTAPEEVAAVGQKLGIEITPEEVRDNRRTPDAMVRPPQVAVIQVDVETIDFEEQH
jgi:acyl carrier protein